MSKNGWIRKIRFLFILICLFVFIKGAEARTVPISEESILGFAEKLYEERQFDKALVEFQRFLYYFPDSTNKYKVMLKMARCYKYSGSSEAATQILSNIISSGINGIIVDRALFELGDTRYLFGDFENATFEFKRVYKKTTETELKERAGIMLTFSYLRANNAMQAAEITKDMKARNLLFSGNIEKLIQGVSGFASIKSKSPFISGTLSAIVPGSGHFYLSRYRDGLLAFVLNALFIACAVEFFEEGHIAPGVLFSVIETSIYTGTIFSSVSQTHKYNNYIRTEYLDDLESEIGFHSYSDFMND